MAVDADIEIYSCDPDAPWQRGTNENIDGVSRHGLSTVVAFAGPQVAVEQDRALSLGGVLLGCTPVRRQDLAARPSG